MADRYLDNATPGGNVSAYTSWANAALALSSITGVDTAGDVVYIASTHNEAVTGAATVFDFAGTSASPTKVLSVTIATPPATLTFGGKIRLERTATSDHEIRGVVYMQGVHFVLGTGTTRNKLRFNAAGKQTIQSCRFECSGTWVGAAVLCNTGFSSATSVELKNCDFSFSAAGQYVESASKTSIVGGSLLSGTTSPSSFCLVAGELRISNFDFTQASAGMHIFSENGSNANAVIRNSKLPASWSGSLVTGTLQLGSRYEMHNCDSSDTNYRLWIADYTGAITSETTVVRTGGASDGSTPLSWKMVTTANAEYPSLALATPEIVRWNETAGSAITATVEIVTDNVTLTDAECWLEVQYLGTSGYPLGSFVSDAKADVLATAANQTTSSETWTTTGLGTPVKQKLSVTFTPQEKGFIHAVVKVAKASTTVYVDPKIEIT